MVYFKQYVKVFGLMTGQYSLVTQSLITFQDLTVLHSHCMALNISGALQRPEGAQRRAP